MCSKCVQISVLPSRQTFAFAGHSKKGPKKRVLPGNSPERKRFHLYLNIPILTKENLYFCHFFVFAPKIAGMSENVCRTLEVRCGKGE